jgi:hypothetical protein
MATDPFASGTILGGDALLMHYASFIPARNCLIAGLRLAGLRRFAKAEENCGGATTNRNDHFSQIHMKPKRFIQRSQGNFLIVQCGDIMMR